MKKITAIVIALVMLMGTAQASGMHSVTESTEQEVITQMVKGSDKYMSWDLAIPQLRGIESTKVQKDINKTLAGDIIRFKKELHAEARRSYKESKGSKYPYRPYEIQSVYQVHYLEKNVLSLTVDKYQYTGGAHGLTMRNAYNYDLCTGKELGYQDIFKDCPDYQKVIVNSILEAIEKNPDDYFEDAPETVKGFTDKQPFYITGEGIVVYYGLYEIAPYASGIREFLIPFSLFK